ncbi:unnamed protein product, partial [Mycena citricolor]
PTVRRCETIHLVCKRSSHTQNLLYSTESTQVACFARVTCPKLGVLRIRKYAVNLSIILPRRSTVQMVTSLDAWIGIRKIL